MSRTAQYKGKFTPLNILAGLSLIGTIWVQGPVQAGGAFARTVPTPISHTSDLGVRKVTVMNGESLIGRRLILVQGLDEQVQQTALRLDSLSRQAEKQGDGEMMACLAPLLDEVIRLDEALDKTTNEMLGGINEADDARQVHALRMGGVIEMRAETVLEKEKACHSGLGSGVYYRRDTKKKPGLLERLLGPRAVTSAHR